MKIGIKGKFFNNIKTLYQNDICRVKLEDGLTNPFLANQGVKQGCILSPLLFNIFLADLPQCISGDECNPVKIHGGTHVSSIIWADDIILLSESESGLQSMLDSLSQYTKENGMQINVDKTKVMIFNKTGRFFRRCFYFGDTNLFSTNSYKYLGFIVTPSGEILSGLNDLKDRALRAYFKLKKAMGNYFRLYPKVTIHLFDTLIKPILLYNSDFWGCLKPPSNNPIENTHMRFCKDLLGVQRQTANIGVLLELGRVPIMLYGKKNCIKNWARIAIQGKANYLVLLSYLNSRENQLKWPEMIKECIARLGIGEDNKSNLLGIRAMQRMADIFHQEAFTDINREGSKLRTYAKLKSQRGLENYLNTITNVENRICLSKVRLSNHDLMIEKGRHLRLEAYQRNCPLCPLAVVEDESHFLLECQTFSLLRDEMFLHAKYLFTGFENLSREQKLKYLLSDDKMMTHTGTYLQKGLKLRRFLLNKHKNAL